MAQQKDWLEALPEAFKAYAAGRDVDEVECIVPDLAGMSRGKAMPAKKFSPDHIIHLPVSIFYQTISGADVEMDIDRHEVSLAVESRLVPNDRTRADWR